MTEDALFTGIVEDPDADGPRLVYADWLEDHTQQERAELIQVQCRLEALHEADPARPALARRADDLLAAHREAWESGLPEVLSWRRGFPWLVRVGVEEFLRCEQALRRLPDLSVRLHASGSVPSTEDDDEEDLYDADDGSYERLGQSPLLERWVELETVGQVGHRAFEALFRSPHLANLRRLTSRANEVGPWAAVLANVPFRRLKHLDLYNNDSFANGPSDEGLEKLLASPHLAGLQYLDFGMNDVGDDGALALAESATVANLRALSLAFNFFSAEGIRALGHSPHLGRLTRLRLSGSCALESGSDSSDGALIALIESPLMAQLEQLDLDGNPFSAEAIGRLAGCPAAAGLRSLRMDACTANAGAFVALLGSPHLAGLRRLDLGLLSITDEMADALARAPGLDTLVLRALESPSGEARRMLDRFRGGLVVRPPDEEEGPGEWVWLTGRAAPERSWDLDRVTFGVDG
jgi:uncharacterized protein (TIGR02996 family)